MNAEHSLDWLGALALRGAALLLVVLTLGLLLRRLSAGRRYGLWLAGFAGLLALPLLLIWGPAWRVLPNLSAESHLPALELSADIDLEPVELDEPIPAATQPTPGAVPSTAVSSGSVELATVKATRSIDWVVLVGWLPTLWLVGLVLGLGGLLVTLWRLRRLGDQKSSMQVDLLTEVAQELGLRRLPRLVMGAEDAVPMVWGVWRPCLLLPAGFQEWPPLKLRAVLLHELAHLARRDPFALWLGQLARVLHWFNPLAWLTLRQLRADQERACDDTVLRHGVRASEYAQVVLDLSQQRRPVAGLSLCALAMARSGPVEQRLVAILDGKCSRASATRGWRLLWTTLVLSVALPLAVLHAVESAKARGRIVDRNGVVLAETRADGLRLYPQKELAAHVVGYAGSEGKAGIEKAQNGPLAEGREVKLTLDLELQKLAHEALTHVLGEQGLDRGAVIVLEPNSGDVLAMVSEPGFDPNDFVPKVSKDKWDELISDWRKPMLDRTVAPYAPGSAFKLVSGLAAVQAGVWSEVFECKGSVQYGSKTMLCWISQKGGGHGELNLSEAMMRSCGCYWYQSGNKAGIEAYQQVGSKLGLGQSYGLAENESSGVLPSPEWFVENKPKEKWSDGHTANTAIGQGFVLTSPLQMAVVAATIANRGKLPQPSLLRTEERTSMRADLQAEGLSSEGMEAIRHGMWLVVNGENGTAKSARVDGLELAGKTGTAQFWRIKDGKRVRDNHTWFVGFAPYDQPKIAFAVMIQGGFSGGGTAAPVAKRMVEGYLGFSVESGSPADASSGDAKTLPEEDGSTPSVNEKLQIDADTKWRWRKMQSDFLLPELPDGAHGVKSLLVGDWPRVIKLSFSAPRLEVLQWLESLQVNQPFPLAPSKDPDSLLPPDLSKLALEFWQHQRDVLTFLRDKSEKKWVDVGLWPFGSRTTFEGASLMISKMTTDQVHVVITTSKPSITIAD
jgi:cell division protein FtsI/penicillin-binding protein 2/beta-lactamase regulating signal transducer with metallopeptidase domain